MTLFFFAFDLRYKRNPAISAAIPMAPSPTPTPTPIFVPELRPLDPELAFPVAEADVDDEVCCAIVLDDAVVETAAVAFDDEAVVTTSLNI